MPTEYKNTIIY